MRHFVWVDPGHGGHDPGAVFAGMTESEIVLDIAKQMALFAPEFAIKMALTRTTDEFVTLKERALMANIDGSNPALFLSVHCNADPDPDIAGMPEANGEEVWYYEGSEAGKAFAYSIGHALKDLWPKKPYRGEKSTKSLYVLKHTVMPAALAEVGFIDNSEMCREFANPEVRRSIALALVVGLLEADVRLNT